MHMLYPSLLRCTLLGTSLSLLTACADNHAASQVEAPTPAVYNAPASLPTATISPSKADTSEQPTQSFASWQAAFRQEALSAGIQAAVFDAAFKGVSPDMAVIRADRSQPEFSRPVWEYLDSAISTARVRRGQALLAEHASTLQAIEQRYGVDRRALVAIWGMESNFGQYMGDKSVIAALATLAYEGRRPAFAHEQLLAALRILQHGDVQPSRMRGSWAGAMGQTQFIPSTYNQFAVDFDGDGRRDIWDSSADALASAAHYLQKSGWQSGQPWGFEVTLPSGFDYAQADAEIRKSIGEWRKLGVNNIPAAANQANAVLLLPAGHRGPAFLVLDNFRAILKYNNSTAYGLAIGLLSDTLNGHPGVQAAWPRNDRQLGRSERIELQELLAHKGYAPGAADGIIGANTRKAVRAFQQSLGQPADGYPSHELLLQLR
ncbi:MAG: murein transglycosylase [Pseudomonas sp. PGPPP3]|nr:MAG: murein transglycosylase [Pseudomonas sp. PGPPP3]